MTKMKKMLSVGLAGCMAALAMMMGVGAANIDNVHFSGTEVAIASAAADSFNPYRAVTNSTKVNLNEKETYQYIPWSVYSGFGYWKIHVINDSKSTIKVKIHKGSPTGTHVGDTMIIPAGQEIPFYCDEDTPLSTGAYYLDVSTDGNNNLKGTLYYKFGNTYEDIL